jgi:hypothetical protein
MRLSFPLSGLFALRDVGRGRVRIIPLERLTTDTTVGDNSVYTTSGHHLAPFRCAYEETSSNGYGPRPHLRLEKTPIVGLNQGARGRWTCQRGECQYGAYHAKSCAQLARICCQGGKSAHEYYITVSRWTIAKREDI